jgi:hypothetical protein
VAAAEHRRNLSHCQDGVESCDYSTLTALEASQLALVERQRNYTACAKGYGYCDRSLLTPSEASRILSEPKPVPAKHE